MRPPARQRPDLCSQPTISRWENAPTLREIIRLTYTLVDIWCQSCLNRRSPWCWTSTTRSTLCTATSNWRTIHAVLDRHGLVKRGGGPRHRARGTPLSEGAAPNGLWCADFKGEFKLGNGRYCYP